MQPKSPTNARGIDVSHYETVTDWNVVKASGISFVYCKATEGNARGLCQTCTELDAANKRIEKLEVDIDTCAEIDYANQLEINSLKGQLIEAEQENERLRNKLQFVENQNKLWQNIEG